jgi:hypothetical protein
VALNLVGWICLGFVCLMLGLIARFYQSRAQRRTYYGVFVVCALGFVAGGVWDALTCGSNPDWPLAAMLSITGGLLALAAGHLYSLMLGGPT